MSFIVLGLGMLLDQLLGEPKRYHPLVGFGNCANYLEKRLNSAPGTPSSIATGFFCLALLILPLTIASCIINSRLDSLSWVLAILVVYWAIGFKSLLQHSEKVSHAFEANDLEQARHAASMMVSRDTQELSETQITQSVIESTLENGCDSTFGVLFWYLIGGVPMVIFYRLSNTLDAMWGYRNQRFELFGKSAAKLDDLLNYLPARLTALSYALCGDTRTAIISWRARAKLLASPNGGPVMTSGAGSLDIKLGGPTRYHGSSVDKPFFGGDRQAQSIDIARANRLVARAVLLWFVVILVLSLITHFIRPQ